MKIIPILLAALLALTAATAPARADYAADYQLLQKFEPVLKKNDVAGAKKLIAAPNFRPMMRIGDEFYSIFDQVLSNDQVEIARLMMNSKGWKKTRWNAQNTATPLLTAAAQPKLFPILKDLARQPGFNLNFAAPNDEAFPLAQAAETGNMMALKWLAVQPGIRLNARDMSGETALFDANTPATQFLISLGKMDVNARDEQGQTALHSAIEAGKVTKVRALLTARGIDPNLRDKSETPSTPLDLALARENWEIASVLMNDPKVRVTATQRALLKRLGKWAPKGDRMGL